MASADDFSIEKKAKSAQISLGIISINDAVIKKALLEDIKVTKKEIELEFEKNKKANKDIKNKSKTVVTPKKLILDKTQRDRLRKKIKRDKSQNLLTKLKLQIKKQVKENNLTLNKISKMSKQTVYNVKSLSLWDIDEFSSDELKPKQQKYTFGSLDEFGSMFFNGKLKTTLGPLVKDGKTYYIRIRSRDLNAEIKDENDKKITENGKDARDKQLENQVTFYRRYQNYPKVEAYKDILKEKSEYIRFRKIN